MYNFIYKALATPRISYRQNAAGLIATKSRGRFFLFRGWCDSPPSAFALSKRWLTTSHGARLRYYYSKTSILEVFFCLFFLFLFFFLPRESDQEAAFSWTRLSVVPWSLVLFQTCTWTVSYALIWPCRLQGLAASVTTEYKGETHPRISLKRQKTQFH